MTRTIMIQKASLRLIALAAALLVLNACSGSMNISRNKQLQFDYTPTQPTHTPSEQIRLRLISQ